MRPDATGAEVAALIDCRHALTVKIGGDPERCHNCGAVASVLGGWLIPEKLTAARAAVEAMARDHARLVEAARRA